MASLIDQLRQHWFARNIRRHVRRKLEGVLPSISDKFWQRWLEIQGERDPSAAAEQAKELFNWMKQWELPLEEGGYVTFVYYGEGDGRVSVAGDWNDWNPDAEPLHRLGKTALFALERYLLPDARVGYQFVIDGAWGPDPRNLRRQVVMGEQSILEMPEFKVDSSLAGGDVPRGIVEALMDLDASPLEGKRPIYVFLPNGYDDAAPRRYPVVYFHDGIENLERTRVSDALDRLIARKVIPPVMAVFIPNSDARDQEYTPYFPDSVVDHYMRFVLDTVIPTVDERFKTQANRAGRMMLGQSFGATASFYIAIRNPQLFSRIAGQSGVYFWWEEGFPSIIDDFLYWDVADFRIYLDSTVFGQEPIQSQAFADCLEARGYDFVYERRAGAHNYESWRLWLPDALRYCLSS